MNRMGCWAEGTGGIDHATLGIQRHGCVDTQSHFSFTTVFVVINCAAGYDEVRGDSLLLDH